MKRTVKLFAFAAIAAIAFSCSKETAYEQVENPGTEVVPASELDASRYLVSFGATIEGIDTKASISLTDGSVSFLDGDQVLVVSDSESGTYEYSAGNFAPINDSNAVSLGADVKAYYPAAEFAANAGTVTFTMPEATVENPGTLAPMCAEISGGVAAFKNLGAILRVNLTGAEPVTAIELVASAPIAGSSEVSWSAGNPVIGTLDGAKNVKHGFTTAIEAGTEQTLYFFLPAGITTSLEVRGIYGKKVGEVIYEPYKKISRKDDLTTVRNKVISITKTLGGFFAAGDGSEGAPYQIASADDFKAIATLANATADADGNGYNATAGRTFFGSAGVHYVQTAAIDFDNEKLTSIGVYNATAADAIPFQGTYDGGDKTLSKFTVTGTQAASTGLFEYVDGATLKNITIGTCAVTGENVTGILTGRCIGSTNIENCDLTEGQVTGRNSVGYIAHIVGNTLVKNCTVSNITVITAASGADANNQGGVVGFAGGASKIESCSTSGTIQFTGTASGAARGGIVGKLDSTGHVKECVNNAVVTNALVGSTGGIAGQLTNGTIVSCANTANVSGTSMVGGIVGFAGTTTNDGSATNITFITSCRNAANVTGSANCVGGIAGKLQNGAVMSACYAQGNVTTSTYDVGGLTGLIQINNNNATSRIYVYDCIANMNVSTSRTSGACRTGGAVGNITIGNTGQYVAIDNCGVLDVTITAAGEYVGGFAGWMTGDGTNTNRARIRNCYTLVSSVPGSAMNGGFIGAVTNKAELRYDYFVADDSSDIATATTANYSKKTAAEIQSDATCTTFNGNNFTLNVGSTGYSSAKGWAMTNGYPVPGALIALGSDYYK